MEPISLIVLVIVVGAASAFLDRRMQSRKANRSIAADSAAPKETAKSILSKTSDQAQALGNQASAQLKNLGSQAGEQAKNLGAQTAGAAQSIRDLIPFAQPKQPLAPRFRAWIAGATGEEPDLAQWLASLGDNQFADFTEAVNDFCVSIGVDLNLLVQDELKPMPDLEARATGAVVNYCRSCHLAAAAQTELELFRAYREYVEKPGSRKGRVYGEKLLDRLLEAGLTTVSLSDFLGADPKAKDTQTLQAIQSAAAKHPAAFNQVLKSLAEREEPASVANEPVAAGAAA